MTQRVLWLDAPGGAAGDMILAALIDAGASTDHIEAVLKRLGIPGWAMECSRTRRCGITATRVQFMSTGAAEPSSSPSTGHRHEHSHAHAHSHSHEHSHSHSHAHSHAHAPAETDPGAEVPYANQPQRSWRDIRTLLAGAGLPESVRARAHAVFGRLAEAEGQVHGEAPDDVHFHEVGSVDAILDIVGVCAALDSLRVDRICGGPLPIGRGFVRCAHGLMPLPAPATMNLMKGWPTVPGIDRFEQVTPTGAALWVTLARPESPPPMVVQATGYGAGARSFEDRPNVVRAVLGTTSDTAESGPAVVTTLAQVDDLPGEHIPPLIEALLDVGALDVTVTPSIMKKGRPGMRIEAISRPETAPAVAKTLLRHSSTFGVRQWTAHRTELERWHETVDTPFGPVRVKVGALDGETLQASPEHADVAARAREQQVPTARVYAAAVHAWHTLHPPSADT